MALIEHPEYLASFAVVLLVACGLGRLVLGPSATRDGARTSTAQAVFGILLLSDAFSLALQLDLPFDTTLLAFGLLAALGLVVWTADLVRGPTSLGLRVLPVLLGTGLLLGLSWMRQDPNALDPATYAFLTTTALHRQWVDSNLPGTPVVGLAGTNPFFAASRGAAIGLLWPWSALGWGIGRAMVAEIAQWLVLASVLLLIDVLAVSRWPVLARVILAVGSIATFGEESAVAGAQMGQAFGMLAATAALWFDRYVLARWARLVALGVVGYAIGTGYTEFLAALPLYVACLYLLRPCGWKSALTSSGAVVAGVLIAALVTHGGLLNYFRYQSSEAPLARPFEHDPHSVLDVWRLVVLERPFSAWLLVLLAPLAVYTLNVVRGPAEPRRRLFKLDGIVIAVFVGVLALLTWAVLGNGNSGYAAFKMGSWVGPALIIGGWALTAAAAGRPRQLLACALLLLASYRALGFVWSAASLNAAFLPTAAASVHWRLAHTPVGNGCTLELLEPDQTVLSIETAIAESAAPRRGCTYAALPPGASGGR